MAKNTKNNGQKNTSKKSESASNAKETAQATALVLSLDVKSNHGMRKKLNSERVDAFALHSHDKLSKAYCAQCLALSRDESVFAACKETRLLVVNGVANWIRLNVKTGDYVRNGALSVRECERAQAVYGNVESLKALYGDSVTLLTDKEIETRFGAVKETVTRSLSDKKLGKVTGKVIASGSKQSMTLDVVAWKGEKGYLFANCEDKSNVYNGQRRFVSERSDNGVKASK